MRKISAILIAFCLLLSACGSKTPADSPADEVPEVLINVPLASADELARIVMTTAGIVLDEMVSVNNSYSSDAVPGYVEAYYGLSPDMWSDCAIYRAAAATEACEISIFRLTEQADISTVFNELEEYRHGRQGDFFGYNPEQADIVDNGIVSISADGMSAAVLICDDPSAAEEAFFSAQGMSLPEMEGDMIDVSAPASEPERPEETHHTELGNLPEYWYPYIDPEIDDMTLWDNSAVVAAIKAADDSALDAYGKKLYKEVNKVLKKTVNDGMIALEKERAIYEWLTESCEYDYRHYEVPPCAPRESYEPYGAIVEGTAVCLGFATAFQLFMDVLDIECITVVGAAFESREDHAWNMVKIDGAWYCVDATWDAGVNPEWFGYFNVSSDWLAMTSHQWDYEAYPIAVAEGDGSWADTLWVPVE